MKTQRVKYGYIGIIFAKNTFIINEEKKNTLFLRISLMLKIY